MSTGLENVFHRGLPGYVILAWGEGKHDKRIAKNCLKFYSLTLCFLIFRRSRVLKLASTAVISKINRSFI